MSLLQKLNESNLEALCLGATILGSGGGGSTDVDKLVCQHLFRQTQASIQVLEVEKIADNAVILPLAYMGAPLVMQEKFPSLKALDSILERVEETYGPVTALMPGEIGGANALTPLMLALHRNLPLVNADLIGRAFPELQMNTANLPGRRLPPKAYLASPQGNHYQVVAQTALELEAICREICIKEGSSLPIGLYPMTGRELKKVAVRNSYTLAERLGRSIGSGKFLKGMRLLGSGVVSEVKQSMEKGFLMGKIKVSNDAGDFEVIYQNEYFLVRNNKQQPLCQTPDIIVLLEAHHFLPITTENIKYGQVVECYCYPCDPIWKTPEGLSLSSLSEFKESSLCD